MSMCFLAVDTIEVLVLEKIFPSDTGLTWSNSETASRNMLFSIPLFLCAVFCAVIYMTSLINITQVEEELRGSDH